MNFDFTDDQTAIRDASRRFARERLVSNYRAHDGQDAFSGELIREIGELGLIGTSIAQEFGGLGQDYVTEGIVMEELARADLNVGYILLLNTLNAGIIAEHGSREMATSVVPDICNGRKTSCLALTEPSAGSDAANISLKAERNGDVFVLNGEKTSISMAHQADLAVVFARTGSQEERAHGITAFLVNLDQSGISRTTFKDVGSGVVGRGSIFFDDVEIPAENMVGDEGMGFKQVMGGFDFSRALIGLQCVGPARASLDETWSYSLERKAFGEPIAVNQGVTEPLAVAETQLTAARLLCYNTLWLRDQGRPHTAEAAMCKWWPPQLAFEAIHLCLQLHGHVGYSMDMPFQQRLREVMGLHIGDGTKQIQKMVIARRKLAEARERA
ncbi:MAG: Acyl-CoA dehydrogenase [Alphaproteobacteria bacterium MarineAlpha4_Bin2]|nr:MAG: Acyl-CoA dehydrogenase [Alphaproteobacteria bacterium MarineAlpha4_Bin2]